MEELREAALKYKIVEILSARFPDDPFASWQWMLALFHEHILPEVRVTVWEPNVLRLVSGMMNVMGEVAYAPAARAAALSVITSRAWTWDDGKWSVHVALDARSGNTTLEVYIGSGYDQGFKITAGTRTYDYKPGLKIQAGMDCLVITLDDGN